MTLRTTHRASYFTYIQVQRRKSNRWDKIGEIVKIYPPVQARTTEAHDTSRDRVFKCEIWNPSAAGTHPLVVYSHFSGGNRRRASFLCEHLCSHGYACAAVGPSQTFVPNSAQAGHVS